MTIQLHYVNRELQATSISVKSSISESVDSDSDESSCGSIESSSDHDENQLTKNGSTKFSSRDEQQQQQQQQNRDYQNEGAEIVLKETSRHHNPNDHCRNNIQTIHASRRKISSATDQRKTLGGGTTDRAVVEVVGMQEQKKRETKSHRPTKTSNSRGRSKQRPLHQDHAVDLLLLEQRVATTKTTTRGRSASARKNAPSSKHSTSKYSKYDSTKAVESNTRGRSKSRLSSVETKRSSREKSQIRSTSLHNRQQPKLSKEQHHHHHRGRSKPRKTLHKEEDIIVPQKKIHDKKNKLKKESGCSHGGGGGGGVDKKSTTRKTRAVSVVARRNPKSSVSSKPNNTRLGRKSKGTATTTTTTTKDDTKTVISQRSSGSSLRIWSVFAGVSSK
jgi:hypothetical protein